MCECKTFGQELNKNVEQLTIFSLKNLIWLQVTYTVSGT